MEPKDDQRRENSSSTLECHLILVEVQEDHRSVRRMPEVVSTDPTPMDTSSPGHSPERIKKVSSPGQEISVRETVDLAKTSVEKMIVEIRDPTGGEAERKRDIRPYKSPKEKSETQSRPKVWVWVTKKAPLLAVTDNKMVLSKKDLQFLATQRRIMTELVVGLTVVEHKDEKVRLDIERQFGTHYNPE